MNTFLMQPYCVPGEIIAGEQAYICSETRMPKYLRPGQITGIESLETAIAKGWLNPDGTSKMHLTKNAQNAMIAIGAAVVLGFMFLRK